VGCPTFGEPLIRAAREAVASACRRVSGRSRDRAGAVARGDSTIGSVVKRHGRINQMGHPRGADGERSFCGANQCQPPLTKGAAQLLDSKNADANLVKINLSAVS
jgi:hypothetical protein